MHELPLLSAAACAIADTDDGRALQAISAMLSRRNGIVRRFIPKPRFRRYSRSRNCFRLNLYLKPRCPYFRCCSRRYSRSRNSNLFFDSASFRCRACALFIDAINSRVDKLFNALQNLRYHVHKPVCRALSVGRHNTNISLFLGDKCQRRDAHTDGTCSCKRETGITVCFISCLFALHIWPYSPPPTRKARLSLETGSIIVFPAVTIGLPTTVLTSTIRLICSIEVCIMFSMGCIL